MLHGHGHQRRKNHRPLPARHLLHREIAQRQIGRQIAQTAQQHDPHAAELQQQGNGYADDLRQVYQHKGSVASGEGHQFTGELLAGQAGNQRLDALQRVGVGHQTNGVEVIAVRHHAAVDERTHMRQNRQIMGVLVRRGKGRDHQHITQPQRNAQQEQHMLRLHFSAKQQHRQRHAHGQYAEAAAHHQKAVAQLIFRIKGNDADNEQNAPQQHQCAAEKNTLIFLQSRNHRKEPP